MVLLRIGSPPRLRRGCWTNQAQRGWLEIRIKAVIWSAQRHRTTPAAATGCCLPSLSKEGSSGIFIGRDVTRRRGGLKGCFRIERPIAFPPPSASRWKSNQILSGDSVSWIGEHFFTL